MAVDTRKLNPPSDTPWRVIDYINDRFLALWNMTGGEADNPVIVAGFEYWDKPSKDTASASLERIAKTMNVIDGGDPKFRIVERPVPGKNPIYEEVLLHIVEELVAMNFGSQFLDTQRNRVLQELNRLAHALPDARKAQVEPEERAEDVEEF
jgi:hypothetical protein